MRIFQGILHGVEANFFGRLVPFLIALFAIGVIYNFAVYRGLGDPQSMDNAQLARQLVRGQGFTTKFIRPAALGLLTAQAASALPPTPPGGAPPLIDLFPRDRFPTEAERIVPDTYNAPGYPYLLAGWFAMLRPHFEQDGNAIAAARMYSGDRVIPWLNQIFLCLTAALLYIMGRQIFDERVAWMAVAAFLVSDLVWQYSITALSTSFLMFLVTAALSLAVKIFSVGETKSEDGDSPSFWPAWLWTLLLGVVLGVACLTRLHLLVLLVPLGAFLLFVPRANFLLVLFLTLVVAAFVGPWFWHMTTVSGSPVGSNAQLLQLGPDEFPSNQIYRTLAVSADTRLLKDMGRKESAGFLWNFERAWPLLGASPLVILFVASLLYTFRRRRAVVLRWLIVGAAFALVAANSLCMDAPQPVDEWNIVVLLLPGMLLVGSAFFFILLDRLNLEHRVLAMAITILVIAVSGFPLTLSLLRTGSYGYYNYPPYAPAYLKFLAHFVPPNRWITTDMPWATAWYGDHSSLWLPDTVSDFDKIYDDDCPSGVLLLTPVLLSQPASNLTSGEDKEWLPFVVGTAIPPSFPLSGHAPMQHGGPEYIVWAQPRPAP